MKNSIGITIGVIGSILVLGVGLGIGYYFGNANKKQSVEPTPTITPVPDEAKPVTINYSIQKNNDSSYELLINGKSTTLTGTMEDSFRSINHLSDLLVVQKYDIDFSSIYVIDSNANIVAHFLGKATDVKDYKNVIQTKGYYTDSYIIDDNSIFIETNDIAPEPIYQACHKNDNDAVEYTEKFNYLGNGKFSAATISKTVTAKEYIESNNISCE